MQAAAADLVQRSQAATEGFASRDPRVDMAEPRHGGPSSRDRPISALMPGFSAAGDLAVVRLLLPWSIHHADATFVLARGPDGWKVLVRQFTYYP